MERTAARSLAQGRGDRCPGHTVPVAGRTLRGFERLEELLQIAHQMWRGDERPYEGTHYQLARPLSVPNALQRPHPPILIGGNGERKTLRLVARYADACNLFDLGGMTFQDDLAHKVEVIRAHCRELDRDYGEIEKTTSTLLDLDEDGEADLQGLFDHLRALAALGIDHVLLGARQPWDDSTLATLASIVPEVHAIRTRADANRP